MTINIKIGEKLKQLRKDARLFQDQLAAEFQKIDGRDQPIKSSTIGKWENNTTTIPLEQLKNYTTYFDVTAAQLLDDSLLSGMREEGIRFDLPEDHFARNLHDREHNFSVKMTENVLDQLGIVKGDTLIFNNSKEKMDQIKSEDVVIANLYDSISKKHKTIIRQFIYPGQLVTNSIRNSAPTLQVIGNNPTIMGVKVFNFRDNQ